MAGIINIGVSALNAFKRQMETTGHNIANVNTEGYSRQVVQFDTREPGLSSVGYIGSGVDVASVQRRYDDFLAARVRDYSSSHEEFAVYQQRASQIDNVIADSATGIDEMLQQFFAAVNDVADDPTSISARSVMLNRAGQLSDRFTSLDGWLEDMRHQLNQDLELEVNEMNSLAQSLAAVNARITAMNGAPGGIPNDVLDQRDKLIDDLSKYTNVSTLAQSDGTVNVFIGTGQALVVGTNYSTLGVTNNAAAADRKEIVIRQAGGLSVNVTAQMTGGSLGGLLRFRDEVLDETQNALGRMAIGLGSFFNAEHQTGMDLDSQLGGDFFTVAGPQVLGHSANNAASNIAVAFDDVADLTTHEYELRFDGSSWTMADLNTGGTVALSGVGTPANPFVADGMRIVIGSATAGDSYRLRPTRLGASSMDVLVSDERDIAAADPVRTSAASGNSGTGTIVSGALTARSTSGPGALPAVGVTLTFDSTLNRFNVSSGGTIAYNPATDSGSTLTLSLAGLGDFSFEMTGTPGNGDQFLLADNAGGVGDNRNARHLADLQNANLMIGGTASFGGTYGALIADVGTKTSQAAGNANVQNQLLGQAEAAKSEVSGVNLDEEAADLVRFQQAYQAAAQVISVANSLFDSLLSAVRR